VIQKIGSSRTDQFMKQPVSELTSLQIQRRKIGVFMNRLVHHN